MNAFKKPPILGIALIVSGPSGAGKSTVINSLRERKPELRFSVSCTTRSPRPGETDGVEYHFISEEEFLRRRGADEFIEHANVHDNFYGTLRSEVIDAVNAGDDVLLDIDVQGATRIRERIARDSTLERAVELVFIGPPNFAELERRLRSRGTESEEVIEQRLENAKIEMDHWREYDFLVINKTIDNTVDDMVHLIDIMHKRTKRLENSGFYI